jgi:Flp pilus assembly protein TadD
VRAEALYRLADLSATHHPKGDGRPPVWDGDRVAAALRAFDQLPLAERVQSDVIAAVAVLQLKGEGNAGAALRTIDPLVAHEASLNAAQLEALGVVLTANDRGADAVRVLSRARQLSRPPSVGCLVALARAFHKNRQRDEAERTLRDAEFAPGRSDREQAELVATKLLFQREKP